VTIAALGWRQGDRLTLTAAAGVVVARRDPGGPVTMAARPYVAIPAPLTASRGKAVVRLPPETPTVYSPAAL